MARCRSARVDHRRLSSTFFCRSEKKDSMAALSAHADPGQSLQQIFHSVAPPIEEGPLTEIYRLPGYRPQI